MNWEAIVRLARAMGKCPTRGDGRDLAAAVLAFDDRMKTIDGRLPASWKPFAVHVNGYEKPASTMTHEESRDGGHTWREVPTPADGEVVLEDGVMVRKAVR